MTDQPKQALPRIAVLELRAARNGFVVSAISAWPERDRVAGYATYVVESKEPDAVAAVVAAILGQVEFGDDAFIPPARTLP